MDFADAPEHAEFCAELRHWLEANLSDDLRVEDAQDQRIPPDRDILEKRIAWRNEYGGRGANFMQRVSSLAPAAPRWAQRVPGAWQYTIAGGTSDIQRNIIGERVLGLPRE